MGIKKPGFLKKPGFWAMDEYRYHKDSMHPAREAIAVTAPVRKSHPVADTENTN